MLANAPGFLLNRTVFFSLVTLSGICRDNPVVAPVLTAQKAAPLLKNGRQSTRACEFRKALIAVP